MEASVPRREDEHPQYVLPVDSENKATKFRLTSLSPQHMRAFHLSWISFFACFVSSFAAPPLLPVIRDNLNLTASNIGNAGIASVTGAIFARLAMGTACDLFGPRITSASIMLLTSPAVYLTTMVNSPTSFILARFFTGFSLSTFVSNQFWMSSMFSAPVVGMANSVAAGWGNLGGGAAQLLMPFVYSRIQHLGVTDFTAWRIAFFVPAFFQIFTAFAILLFGQDLPEGNFRRLQNSGEKQRDEVLKVFYHGITNYRGWILALTYGCCFGVELTIDNIIAEYFYDRFNLKLQTAGFIAASFGLANIVSRPAGGWISDKLAKRYGMRGRLWGLWTVQTIGGVLCILLGRATSLEASVTLMIFFSFFVQAACGLTYGIVPFVSRRSLGLISGMVGAGGNVGAVLTQLIFFKGSRYKKEEGITFMGITYICCTFPIWLIYFPQWGGMAYGPSSRENATAKEYYSSEWSADEKEKGLHQASVKFADNSKSERGRRVSTTSTPTRLRN